MEIIHFQPISYTGSIPIAGTHNVHCLNGSAHVRYSKDIKDVTCPLCLNPETCKDYWSMKREEIRTKKYYSPITGLKFAKYQNP